MDTATPQNTSLPPPDALSHRQAMFIILGVMLPVFMGSLDQTVLASALPTIGAEFGDFHNLPWLITAYLIAMTATTPLYGKFSDIHGRRNTLLVALGLHLLGSLICAMAPNLFVLILGRAVQGLGGGGLTSTGMVVLGDIASPRERGKYYAYFAAVYTTSGALGPALGGAVADHLHWSAIFWMNIPLGILSMVLAHICLRRMPRRERYHRLDALGAVLVVAATVSFMLAINMGGVAYPWSSPPILAFVAAAAVLAAGFGWRLLTAPEPLIPLRTLADRVVATAIACNTFGWAAVIGLNIFMPMYLQTAIGLSPTMAGLSLVSFMMTLNIGAGIGGWVIGRMNRYKTVPVLCLVLAVAAIFVLAWRAGDISPLGFQVVLCLIGLGFGPVAPLATVSVQNAVPPHQFGTVLGAMNFLRMLSATIFVAIFGAVVAAGLGAATTEPERAAVFGIVFFLAGASMLVALVALTLLPERPLKTSIEG
ncbi:MAG TPA: MFS transporter [Xanthobacteraceae bacterium]|nr:MFS transporter [Xanthobacteraceae bacterium]